MPPTRPQCDVIEPPSTPTADGPSPDGQRSKADRLRRYLVRRTDREGECYVKSKFIADDVGLSSKEIGALMVRLQEADAAVEIEKWAYSSATTWRVAPA